MKLILVPHTATQTEAVLWAAATETDAAPQNLSVFLMPGDRRVPLPDNGWRIVTAGGLLEPAESKFFVQRVRIDNLNPGTVYRVRGEEASARFTTLPAELPGAGQRPFTVLLSSCYAKGNDPGGLVGRAVREMDEAVKPDLKILCGDQVYLDYPAFIFGVPYDIDTLATNLLTKYRRNWADTNGFQELLATGGSYFTADDHEFWNNYPNWTSLISNTWTSGGRNKIKRVALSLYQDFQTDDANLAGRPRRFDIGALSFFVADTRVLREPGNSKVMTTEDFDSLRQWIGNLRGPGVLVVGQPVFHKAAGWFRGRFEDRALADYAQYDDLVRALVQTKHSVVVLTGDVHYGRIASCSLWQSPNRPEIIEIIASPSSLVNAVVGGRPEDAPDKFPPEPVSGVVQAPTKTFYKTSEDHFVTLDFTRTSGRVRVQPRYWFPRKTGSDRMLAANPIDLL